MGKLNSFFAITTFVLFGVFFGQTLTRISNNYFSILESQFKSLLSWA